jgi:hypothetical protein
MEEPPAGRFAVILADPPWPYATYPDGTEPPEAAR